MIQEQENLEIQDGQRDLETVIREVQKENESLKDVIEDLHLSA